MRTDHTEQHEPKDMTVLLVDDDQDCRIIYSSALRAAGFRVLLAVDGVEGVDLTRAEHPDVVVMDVAMPRLNGCDAVRALKQDPNTRSVPTLALTAALSMHHRGELTDAGFDAVLLKPVSPKVVITAIRQAIESWHL